MKTNKNTNKVVGNKHKKYLSQSEVPYFNLENSLRIVNEIQDQYGGQAVTPIQLSKALGMQPSTGGFRMLCGSSIAYGLTEGGYNATEIKLTPIAIRILRPLVEGDDIIAKRESFLTPRIIREFIKKYEKGSIPRDDIGMNVLSDMGVPSDRTKEVLKMIIEGAQSLGIITEIKGKKYIDLKSSNIKINAETENNENPIEENIPVIIDEIPKLISNDRQDDEIRDNKRKRVFITHGKDKTFVEPIKKLLSFGELEPIVAAERQSVSQPVPDKVMNDMRSCGAAIIHVDAEEKLVDKEANERIVLNPNVLIEIGAAMALYGRRFILLVKNGLTLPSNLQGLFEVRYDGDNLGGDVTIKLLEAIKDMKSKPFPEESKSN